MENSESQGMFPRRFIFVMLVRAESKPVKLTFIPRMLYLMKQRLRKKIKIRLKEIVQGQDSPESRKHNWIEPPKEAAIENPTGCLRRVGIIRGLEIRSLAFALQQKEDHFDSNIRCEQAEDCRVNMLEVQSADLDGIERERD